MTRELSCSALRRLLQNPAPSIFAQFGIFALIAFMGTHSELLMEDDGWLQLSAVVENVRAYLWLRKEAASAGLVTAEVAVTAGRGATAEDKRRAPGTLTVEGSAAPGAPTAEGATTAADLK